MAAVRVTAYEFGPYRLDSATRSVTRAGQLVPLPPKAVDVLLELVTHAASVVSRQALIDRVWPNAFVDEANLNQMIFLLRRALDNGPACEYIVTSPRRGYRFSAPVRPIESGYRIESIAVLPFANLSGDPAHAYFADGVTEALITELARIGTVRVVSRISALRYRGRTDSVPQIARALRVETVVQGSVTVCRDRVRITAQVIHAASEQHLWADTYEGAVSDILEVQAQVARACGALVREGREEATSSIQTQPASAHRVRPDAYALYLKGRYFARHLTEAGQQRAVHYFQQAIDTDPEFAAAYAGLAECFTELAYFFGMEPKAAFTQAERAATKAVELDETLAEGHAVLSLVRLLHDWDWRAADAESHRAIELAPGDAYVYWRRGVYLRYAGFAQEAIAAHRTAESLDPFSLVAIEEVGWPLYYARRFDEAAEQFQKAVELEANWDQLYFGLGMTFVEQGRHEEAIRALRRAADMAPENPLTHVSLVYALGRAGRSREAEDALRQLTTKHAYVPNFFLSLVWVGLNQKERALESLEDAFNEHEPCVVSLKVDPVFDPLRDDPRFSDMVRRVGLEP